MNAIKCPKCIKPVDIYIDALYPMQAVAADMLEQGIIIDCLKCQTRINDISMLVCPQCGKNGLIAEMDEDTLPLSLGKNIEGRVNCSNCEFKLLVRKEGGILPI